MSKEFSVQDEIKTDEEPKKIKEALDVQNEGDEIEESKTSTEKNKTPDSDTAG